MTKIKKSNIKNNNNGFATVAAAVAAVAAATVAAVAAATVAAAAAAVAAVAAAAVAAAAAAAVAAAADNNYKKSYIWSGISFLLSIISFCLSSGADLHLSLLFNWLVLILVLILMEVYFFSPINRKKKLTISQVLGRKLVGLFYSCLSIFGVFIFYQITKNYWMQILKWIGYIGAGIIVLALIIGIIYAYLKLNQYAYNRK